MYHNTNQITIFVKLQSVLGDMDQKSYLDIFRLNIDIQYISQYFFCKVSSVFPASTNRDFNVDFRFKTDI